MGRPTVLTDEVREHIAADIEVGMWPETAARRARIGASTYYRWMERGARERTGIYQEFRERIERAQAECRGQMEATVANAASRDWKAALAFLQRRHRDEWGDKPKPPPPPPPGAEPADPIARMEHRLEQLRSARASAQADRSWVAVKDILRAEAEMIAQIEAMKSARESEERARQARESQDIDDKRRRIRDIILSARDQVLVEIEEALAERRGRTARPPAG